MKLQIVICLCIASALAYPENDETDLVESKQVIGNNVPPPAAVAEGSNGGPSPSQSIDPLAEESESADDTKESLEPAASAWGGRGWGGGRGGYGGYGYRGWGGYGNRGWGGGYGGGWGGGWGYGRRQYGGWGGYW